MWNEDPEVGYGNEPSDANVSLRDIPLHDAYFRQKLIDFLSRHGLKWTEPDCMAGIYDDDTEELLACGGLDGSTIKCLAVSPQMQHLNLAGMLVTHLTEVAFRQGHTNVTVFTKPVHAQLFTQMGFHLIGQATDAILLESNGRALKQYTAYLQSLQHEGKKGVIVLNGNPLTRGHLYLISEARRRCDWLYVILVGDHSQTLFSYADRRSMLLRAVENDAHIISVEGSIYSVSQATFPTYFIKGNSRIAQAHIELDLDIFARHLAPALGATVRFVGAEPLDALTAAYNEGMHRLLPPRGIEVIELERMTCNDSAAALPLTSVANALPQGVISATQVRQCLQTGETLRTLRWVAPPSVPFVLTKAAVFALQAELNLTPKPGLIDQANNGAHRDMDYALMYRSIEALEPTLKAIALAAYRPQQPDVKELQAIGLEGERQMLRATCGVNTHKGALFAFGWVIAAAAHLWASEGSIETVRLQQSIASLANGFPAPDDTHGAAIRQCQKVNGAVENARQGYPQLFDDWLPYYRSLSGDDASHRLLLRIMATLDDTNVLHRAGAKGAETVKQQAQETLSHFSLEKLNQLDRQFITQNISPGGAADMLALTLFVSGLCAPHGNTFTS